MTFTSDELILILISLVRATRPAMLRQEADGFSVDFEALGAAENLDDDGRLLLKLRAAMETPAEGAPPNLDLAPAEGRRLAQTLAHLETLQAWPGDVMAMSRALRARLAAVPASETQK